MLEAAKDRVIVGPAFGLVHNAVFEGDARRHDARRRRAHAPAAQARGDLPHLSSRCASAACKVVIGGDYGFKITPMGQNARDIGHFVKFFGYSPAEALALRNLGRRRIDGSQGRTRRREGRRARRSSAGRRQSARRSFDPGRAGSLRDDHEGWQDASRSARPRARARQRQAAE